MNALAVESKAKRKCGWGPNTCGCLVQTGWHRKGSGSRGVGELDWLREAIKSALAPVGRGPSGDDSGS